MTDDASPNLQGNRVVRDHGTGFAFGGRAPSVAVGNRVEGNGVNGILVAARADFRESGPPSECNANGEVLRLR